MKTVRIPWKHTLMLSTLLVLSGGISAFGMNTDGLVDAVANGSKLTKADAGRAVDAIVETLSSALANEARKKGDRISLVGFGTFSVSERVPSDSDTCVPVADVDFEPADAFAALINPVAMDKGLRFRVRSVGGTDKEPVVTGPVQTGEVFLGDIVVLQDTPDAPAGVEVEVAGVWVDGVAVDGAGSGQDASLLLRGIEKKDIKRGMVIIKKPAHREPGPPVSPCFPYLFDEQIAAGAAKLSGLRYESVLLALQVAKETVMETVAAGYAVDIDGLGVFYVTSERVLSVIDPGTDLSAEKARKVKFKAGAELSSTVNK